MDTQKPQTEGDNFAHPTDVTKKDRFAGIKTFLKKRPPKKRLLVVGGVGLAVLLAGSTAAFTLIKDTSEPTPVSIAPAPEPEPEQKFYSQLTGLETTEALSNKVLTAVMIENSVDARPQAGLEEAGVVFEAIAEGGITRFMAVYQETEPERIGPIRSARPYYVEWAAGLDAAYAHSGGSGKALSLIQKLGVMDLDHGKESSYFERVSNRFAPHNVYTDMKRLDSFKSDKGYKKSDFTPFARIQESEADEKETTIDDAEAAETTAKNKKATEIEMDISSPLYNTSYTYDEESNAYKRSMASRKHVDEVSGKQITPSVVVAMYTDYSIDPNGIHSVYRTSGTGTAIVFQNGEVIEAKWSKKSQKEPLRLLTKDNEPLELVPGQTWITAIPKGRVSYSAS